MKWIVAGLVAIVAVAVGAWWWEGHRAETALLAQPVYRVLEKHETALFEKLVGEYRLYLKDELSREQFTNTAAAGISEAATLALGRASQESLLALITDMLATARKLEHAPDNACFRFWFPLVAGPPDVAHLVDAKSQQHTLELMGEVIRSAAESPAPIADPEAVKDDFANIVNATYEQFGSDAQMIGHASDPRVDRTKVCVITISFYERILRLPPAKAINLLRVMAQG